MLMDHYFSPQSVYPENLFERRFRMPKRMFLRILEDITAANDYFKLKCNAAGKPGLSGIQKCAAAIRQLAYGTASDATDEYIQIGESTANEAMKEFCRTLLKLYREIFLRPPNQSQKAALEEENASRGFPGMIGSIDCMHWEWKNCPVALKGQYQGKEGKATVVLEAVASYNCRIWYCNFGAAGSCNDINILDNSPLLDEIIHNGMLDLTYEVNGKTRERGYLLGDGIYPDWSCFVKTISHPSNAKEQHFATVQESVRKDVERCFSLLTNTWQITKQPCRLWDLQTMILVMEACIILHNMRIEYNEHEEVVFRQNSNEREPKTFTQYCEIRAKIKCATENAALRKDLIDHLWHVRGEQ
ncbi:uncharacterized protein LOC109407066 [Aedes albopictus]|uniref:DDE Tnp4 domain-containing protein n=2 Tax=Aedes albopictus TaxID=7160 RepID=A0ABM1XZE2_AEDAL